MAGVGPDVLIIGAGPAGAVAAALLAQRGYQVLVQERQHFPRFSIGESLLAYSTQLLQEAGMLDAVVAGGFQFKNGATFVCDDQFSEFNFADKFTAGCSFTFQVVRSQFDHLLANEAARRGATVQHGVEITAVEVGGERPQVTTRSEAGEIVVHRPRFVLDASGFGRTLARLLELEKPSSFPVRAARFCHVKDGIVSGAFDRQKIRIGINPDHRDVWSWLIPFPNGTSSLGIVASRDHLARFTGTDEERFWALIGDEPRLRVLLEHAHTVRPIGEIVGYAANVSALHGPGLRAAGQRRRVPRPGVLVRRDHRAALGPARRGRPRPPVPRRGGRLAAGVRRPADVRHRDLPHVRQRLVRWQPSGRDLLSGQGPRHPSHDLLGARRLRVGRGQPLHRPAVGAPAPCARGGVPGRKARPACRRPRGTIVTSGHAITAAALANCLGTDNRTVFDRAFAGDDAFVPASAFHAFPFATVLGVMPRLDVGRDAPGCVPTRVATVALASVQQIRPAVRAAVQRWGARRVAYVFASSTGGLEETERSMAPDPRLPLSSTGYRYADHGIDATSAAIAHSLGAHGVCMAISTACSSSFNALASALRLIDRGLADAVVVGSADSLCRTTVFGFHSLGLTAPTATQPFARDRSGITLGEGSAYVLVERDDGDTRRRAIARIAGIGAASDAFHHTSPHPEGIGGQLCMRQALDRAGVSPDEIDCVSAHGTGTRLNDAAEAIAVRQVFGRRVPMTATKSLTGHTLGSAGLTALVLAIESLRRQAIPATLRLAPPDDSLGVAVVDRLTPAAIRHVLVNAFGFGGSNVSAVVSRPDPRPS